MIPAELDYFAPTSIEEAIAILSSKSDAKVLGGGMSLIPAIKHRLTQPAALVDLARIPNLDRVTVTASHVVIGGRATHAAVGRSDAAKRHPILAETAHVLGDEQVRNRGTFGGSLVHADPAADWPAVFLAVEGEADVVGPKGRRTIPAKSFFESMMTSAVRADEVLVEARLPFGAARTGAAYEKVRQPASGFALAGVAAVVTLDEVQRMTRVRLGVTGVNAVPFRATSIESRLVGQVPDQLTFRSCCGSSSEVDPMEDLHASADYRRHLLSVLATRALHRACERALA